MDGSLVVGMGSWTLDGLDAAFEKGCRLDGLEAATS